MLLFPLPCSLAHCKIVCRRRKCSNGIMLTTAALRILAYLGKQDYGQTNSSYKILLFLPLRITENTENVELDWYISLIIPTEQHLLIVLKYQDGLIRSVDGMEFLSFTTSCYTKGYFVLPPSGYLILPQGYLQLPPSGYLILPQGYLQLSPSQRVLSTTPQRVLNTNPGVVITTPQPAGSYKYP